jgi:hypothetical protein
MVKFFYYKPCSLNLTINLVNLLSSSNLTLLACEFTYPNFGPIVKYYFGTLVWPRPKLKCMLNYTGLIHTTAFTSLVPRLCMMAVP